MDPFIGSGTTALVCRMMNYDCIGFDILPTSKLAIEVKSNILNYNIEEIKKLKKEFESIEVPSGYDDLCLGHHLFNKFLEMRQQLYKAV